MPHLSCASLTWQVLTWANTKREGDNDMSGDSRSRRSIESECQCVPTLLASCISSELPLIGTHGNPYTAFVCIAYQQESHAQMYEPEL